MKLGLAALCLAVLTLLTQQARAESIRWMQPDFEPGDTWEYRVVSVEVEQDWQPMKELWNVGEIRGAVVEPLVSMTVEARTTRNGVTGAVSAPKLYVPEPSLSVGLAVGCAALAFIAFMASRPQGAQKWRSFKS